MCSYVATGADHMRNITLLLYGKYDFIKYDMLYIYVYYILNF